ncbi:MAG: dephospho-CoA kinase [Candidatus Polarisedimenticolia bacterium]
MTPHDHRAGHDAAGMPPGTQPAAHRARPFVLRVGLTGGIATGKSTVARIFASLGASILDADEVAHRLIEKTGPAYAEVAAAFGPEILRPDGSIDRARLGRIVFGDAQKRARLESILHPLIRKEEAALVGLLGDTGQGRISVTNAALLIETGFYRDYHRVVVVQCDREAQIDRILKRDGLTPEETAVRIAAQMDAREKAKHAHYVIDTTPGIQTTEARARVVFRHLQHDLQALGEPL